MDGVSTISLSLIFFSLLSFFISPLSLRSFLHPFLTAATQYPSNGAVGGRGLEEPDEYVDNQGGTLQFDDQYQGEYECE